MSPNYFKKYFDVKDAKKVPTVFNKKFCSNCVVCYMYLDHAYQYVLFLIK